MTPWTKPETRREAYVAVYRERFGVEPRRTPFYVAQPRPEVDL
ncbi:hypothetical protein ACFT5B_14245 [Luteimicrobium sp. NPDC057192]